MSPLPDSSFKTQLKCHLWSPPPTHTHTHTSPGGCAARELPPRMHRQVGTVARSGGGALAPSRRPPTARAHTRARRGREQGPAGRERRGAGPRSPGRGQGAGAGRRPAHVGGREQLKVRSGAGAVLSRAALAGAAAAKEEEEEAGGGGGGGGDSRGEDGGGVGLEPSGGASCPGRCGALARRAPTPEPQHPAVPSSARVRAPAGSAPGLPPE